MPLLPPSIMRTIVQPFLSIATFTIVLLATIATGDSHEIGKELFDATQVFVESLNETQRNALISGFDSDLRKDWQFVPMEREGLSFADMEPNQRLLGMSLIQTALSHRGFSQSMQIMALEQVLHELENQSPKRNPEKYHLFVFGQPSLGKTWGWRVEGHHLSISFTIVDGQTVTSTPAFFGSNPGEVRSGALTGLRVLGNEEDLGRRLIKDLSVEQKKSAIVSETAPNDVINGPGRDASPQEPAGIAASEMTVAQQRILREMISSHIGKLRSELADQDWQKIDEAGFDKIHFAWAGEIQRGKPHYYRVQGPTFIIEYDNTQDNANHVHTVYRDFENDFGADLLKEHYEAVPHEEE